MKIRNILLYLSVLLLVACSDETDKVEGDHVWKEQTDMIDKAKGIEALINDAAEQQQELIDKKTQ